MASNNLAYTHDTNFFEHDGEVSVTKCTETLTCFNGGGCSRTADDKGFCICNVSDEKGRYVGVDCSIRTPEDPDRWCNPYGDFCLNKGTCNDDISPDNPSACNCPTDYTGKYCELKVSEIKEYIQDDEDRDKPIEESCTLDCQNQGECTFGYRNPTVPELTLDNNVTSANVTESYQHCQCPPGFSGLKCENAYEICSVGEDENPKHFCHNGATCVDFYTKKNDKDTPTEHHQCDCHAASVANNGKHYVGAYCEHEDVKVCTPGDDTSFDVRIFCANDGKCRKERIDDEIFYTCDCTNGFSGKHCEVPEDDFFEKFNHHPGLPSYPNRPTDETCTKTKCENGGKCYKGAKDSSQTILGNMIKRHRDDLDHILNYTAVGANMYGEHCQCPSGFTGLHCEIDFAICPESQHVCFHGTTCVDNGKKCSCNNKDNKLRLAGRFCQHKATAICGEHACYNGGECIGDHCRCPEGFRGPYCSFSHSALLDDDDLLTQSKLPEKYSDKLRPNLIIFSGVMCFVGVLGIIVAIFITNRNKEESYPLPSTEDTRAPPNAASPPSQIDSKDKPAGNDEAVKEDRSVMHDVELL